MAAAVRNAGVFSIQHKTWSAAFSQQTKKEKRKMQKAR